MHIQPVILCGGSGTRLWPLSREQYPKQLLTLSGNVSMLQATAKRLDGLDVEPSVRLNAPLLVGNEEYRFLIAQQLKDIGQEATILLEPCGRNTAPALTLAALVGAEGGSDPLLVVMPADHVIQDQDKFQQAILAALKLAEQGKLVTLGIKPSAPETGYGYIKTGASLENGSGYVVDRFVEKPDAETAQHYLQSGQYFWNAGIFVMKTSVWLAGIRAFRSDIAIAVDNAFKGRTQDHDFLRPEKSAFEASPSDSIDYAVLEKLAGETGNTGQVAVVPMDAQWSDLGAWSALWDIGEKDARQNVLLGDVVEVDSSNTLAVAQSRLVACVGLNNVVVVETPDAILVADKNRIQSVKDVVARLKKQKRAEAQVHRKVYRPWGWFDSIDSGARFQVKRITVNPGAALSLQMHHHRAEHWIVVSGTARVTRGEETFLVCENESTYIPIGVQHRLENPGKFPLEMIEVQSGSYLGEDDIVRFEDVYGRTKSE